MTNDTDKENDMTAIQLRENLDRNAWNWGLLIFCKALSLNDDDYGREKFLTFQKLADLMGEFDADQLELLFADHRQPAQK